MEIQELGALGEFVSSVAIVVTLIFLTIETRQARNATQQSNRQARHLVRTNINQSLAVNPQLAEVMTKSNQYIESEQFRGGAGGLGLSESESLQLANYFLMFFRHIEDQYFSDLPETDRLGLETQALRAIAIPSFSVLWQGFKDSFHTQFVDYIDNLASS